jgi:hypothetical protein
VWLAGRFFGGEDREGEMVKKHTLTSKHSDEFDGCAIGRREALGEMECDSEGEASAGAAAD